MAWDTYNARTNRRRGEELAQQAGAWSTTRRRRKPSMNKAVQSGANLTPEERPPRAQTRRRRDVPIPDGAPSTTCSCSRMRASWRWYGRRGPVGSSVCFWISRTDGDSRQTGRLGGVMDSDRNVREVKDQCQLMVIRRIKQSTYPTRSRRRQTPSPYPPRRR